ncbi:MAG: metalloregulator ArsR/SmtB family transcription factor [Armatimonadetes bacterium]|nr:metalloregulator ArsR/SmtB family transcription factor [Armatimonadota bacterium]
MPAVSERPKGRASRDNLSRENLTCDAYNDDPIRVRRVAVQMPEGTVFDHTSALLKALADPVRARILYALTIEPLCVCELATLLDMSMPAVSHHLKILNDAGFFDIRKEGKFACYHLRDQHLGGALPLLFETINQAGGN